MDILNPSTESGSSVAYTGTAGSTNTFQGGALAVLVWATTNAYVKVGEGVTATSADTPIPANVPVLLRVPPGSGAAWRVSAIQVASGGTVYAKPVGGAST
jgi:hypothetical protein